MKEKLRESHSQTYNYRFAKWTSSNRKERSKKESGASGRKKEQKEQRYGYI